MAEQQDAGKDTSVSPVRVAVAQFEPRVGVENLKANALAVETRLTAAADAGAGLIVLPELATTGYVFETREEAFAHAEADEVWRLCASLPPRQRAAVVLRYYEGLPDADIAEILGCTAATVRFTRWGA